MTSAPPPESHSVDPTKVAEIALELDAQAQALGTPERAAQEKRYLKSSLTHYGLSAPKLRRLTKPFTKNLDHDTLMALTADLWSRPVFEDKWIAADLLRARADLLQTQDLGTIERYLTDSQTWALVDTLVPYPVGRLSQRDPEGTLPYLDRWSTHDNFWLRRSALLAHLIPLREGAGDWERFTRYADMMLGEKEFFIRKAIGWTLRDTSRKRPDLVRDWVAPRTGQMSGVTIREAVKRLDPQDRERFMAAYRAGESAGTRP